MSDEQAVPTTVHIMGSDYQIACPENERQSLLKSAKYLDEKMKEIKESGRVLGIDRIAVMAALNITHELLEDKTQREDYAKSMNSRIRSLQEKIDTVLHKS